LIDYGTGVTAQNAVGRGRRHSGEGEGNHASGPVDLLTRKRVRTLVGGPVS